MNIGSKPIFVTVIFLLIYLSSYSQKTNNYLDTLKELNYTAADSAAFYIIDINHKNMIAIHNYKSIPIKTTRQFDNYIEKHLGKIKQTRLIINDHDLEDDYPGFLGNITEIIFKYHIKNCTIFQDNF
jgi:hypothetical protein